MPHLTLEQIWPPFGLRLEAGDLVLTALREGDIAALVALVLDGIHDPAHMPFEFPWTVAPAEEIPANYARYVGRILAGQTPEATSLQLVVRRAGEVVGIQALEGADYAVTRTLETGSWLAQKFQGQGIGTRMRQVVCAFAFDHLGAERITSAAFVDNAASRAVSRKVGYETNGREWIKRRGEVAEEERFVLTPETFRRGEPVRVTGAAAYREFLGLGERD